MTRLRDFIDKRMAELKSSGAPLLARRDVLRAELAELDGKLAIINAEWQDLEKAASAIGPEPEPEQDRRRKWSQTDAPTIKDAILLVLSENPKGLSASDLHAKVNERFFKGNLERTSFSPQLSRLKILHRAIMQKGELYFRRNEGPAFTEPS
jgi:hypothetical protein